MKKGFFITGTDTGVGKTQSAVLLVEKLKAQGFSVAGLKPLSSGSIKTAEGLRNEDALALQYAASQEFLYHWVNPMAFELPIAPHLAAKQVGCRLSVKMLWEACQPIFSTAIDYIVVEGAGGFLVPLNNQETMADLAKKINFPVILIVGLRLGCINHSILTEMAINQANLTAVGWIAYPLEPRMPYLHENIETLKQYLTMPYLGMYPDFNLSAFNLPAVNQAQCNLSGSFLSCGSGLF